ncbi:MAG: 16S rRNA (adenine(1518)-N(6)/adenine(1519)-N(6))-dimethyltransferase RsmA [Pseudomonadota bacterium]
MHKPRDVRRTFEDHGLTPKKWMGQNLLVDPVYLDRIIAAAGVEPGEAIVEVGAGLGVLTESLAAAGARVWAIELDAGFFRVLQDKLGKRAEIHLIHADALRYDFRSLAAELGMLRVVANLPYNISSRLIFMFITERDIFKSLTILLQQEVAERLAAMPGSREYGMLSVLLSATATIESLFSIPGRAFLPRTEVTSSLVRISFPESPPVAVSDRKLFVRLVKAAFTGRRKTLRNTLKNAKVPGVPYETLLDLAATGGIDLSRRAETVSAAEFGVFTDAVSRCIDEGSSDRVNKIRKERPDQGQLKDLGIDDWGRWECEPSTFPWQYADDETAYVFEGRVTVKTDAGDSVDIGAGDLVTFPKGMKCTWTVHETIRKMYKFG